MSSVSSSAITRAGSALSIEERLFVALDYPDAASALALAEQLAPLGVSYKVGMQLFYAEGMAVVRQLQQLGKTVFVDLKLHDIPNTVSGSVASLASQGVNFLNVHTQGGPEMMQAAVASAQKAAEQGGQPLAKLIGVTLLTSLSSQALAEFLFVSGVSVSEYVLHLALQAKKAGLDGVVCSAEEAAVIREACGPDFLLVTPGIRPLGSDTDDQARVITPAQALKNGADYLVMGRPITGATDPASATQRILDEMREALT
ncbi:orotidine-5'-phosphate decarboxylase [Vampirovibrio sp.]|uniref:orotidine-5'-phosphate decarboxylase n=1 Tax=Vampirovibrio sp. TaxID=2717857 RepID=UPI0035943822